MLSTTSRPNPSLCLNYNSASARYNRGKRTPRKSRDPAVVPETEKMRIPRPHFWGLVRFLGAPPSNPQNLEKPRKPARMVDFLDFSVLGGGIFRNRCRKISERWDLLPTKGGGGSSKNRSILRRGFFPIFSLFFTFFQFFSVFPHFRSGGGPGSRRGGGRGPEGGGRSLVEAPKKLLLRSTYMLSTTSSRFRLDCA